MHTNLSWCKAILTNTLPQHAAVGCPNVHWFGPTYRRQTQILCSAEWMFHFLTLRFRVSQSSPGPLEDWETTGFLFLLSTMEAFCWFQYFEAGCSMNNLFWTGLPPPFDSVQDLPSKPMDQVWEIMPFYDLLPTPIDNNVLNLLDRIHLPSWYVSWGWLGFFVVIFRQSVKFSQYLRPWPSWQWHR